MPNFWDEHSDLLDASNAAAGSAAAGDPSLANAFNSDPTQRAGAQIYNPNGNPNAGGLPITGVAGPLNAGGAAPAPQSLAGAVAGPQSNGGVPSNLANPFLLGFETNKLFDPSSGSAAGSKYTDDAKAFGQLYLSGVPVGRGNLNPMVDAMHGRGFGNATAVGDDKIDPDGPGPLAPIDVVGSDGSVRYQNTTDNAQWESKYGRQPMGQGPGGLQAGGDGRVGGPMMDGGGGQAYGYGGGPSGGGGPRPTFDGDPAQYTKLDAPTPYTPTAINGPSAWGGQTLTAQSIGYQPVGVGTLMRAGDVSATAVGPQQVGSPDKVQAERVQGPAAIQAERIAAPTPFRATTAADLYNDPSYKFREDRTLAALQNAAAAKGALRSTNTFQALMDKGGEMASQEFSNVDARRFRDYADQNQNALAVGQANNSNAFNAYGLTNQYQQQAALANQNTKLQADLANTGNAINVGQFNAAQANAIGQSNADRSLSAATFNTGQQNSLNLADFQARNQAAQFNAGNQLQSDTFNASSANAANAQNTQNNLAAWQAYQGMAQNAAQFNAGRQDTAAQQNWTNAFNVGQANNAGALAAWQANVNAKLGYGNLDLGYTQAANTRDVGMANVGLGYHQADQSYDLGLRNNALGYTQAGNSFTLGMGNLGLGWANYGLGADNQDFNQRYTLANMGMQANNGLSGAAQGYGTASGNNATNAGNAAAAGRVGQANAWNGGVTGAVNTGIGAYGAYRGGQLATGGGY